ncbi:hypothetical protein BT96DRAFT_936372 [Gymnopus androsaceus JB14]|uniref:Uncharacterized protein n=1 Tax=Gymnopus androsaceus JB14 TaxID=1447944 RepID=A0A6A4HYB2_9AGAR|nr:hypothetical protein BT96DRAFT_936372 [Gymnopus androsaceus JB14]
MPFTPILTSLLTSLISATNMSSVTIATESALCPFSVAFSMANDAPVASTSIQQCAEDAAQLLKKTRAHASFTSKQKHGWHGYFANLNAGVAHGGGRLHPANIVNSKANAAVIDNLINSVPFKRLSGWAPKLYDYCSRQFERLLASDDSLIRIFNNSVLASAAFNFGPRTGLGWFNWKKGGHLVLWVLKLVIEFPPGTIAAIPSGVCRHGNTRIGKNETQYSFTQYSSGGNFRWNPKLEFNIVNVEHAQSRVS